MLFHACFHVTFSVPLCVQGPAMKLFRAMLGHSWQLCTAAALAAAPLSDVVPQLQQEKLARRIIEVVLSSPFTCADAPQLLVQVDFDRAPTGIANTREGLPALRLCRRTRLSSKVGGAQGNAPCLGASTTTSASFALGHVLLVHCFALFSRAGLLFHWTGRRLSRGICG